MSIKSLILRGIQRLPFGLRYEIFYQSARTIGVTGYEVSGDAGAFIGPLHDQSIIKKYAESKTFSPVIVRIFREFFDHRGGGIFYDIGANIGMITVPIAQNPTVKCVSFEPDPRNFDILRRNVLLNCRHNNVETINAAVAHEPGKMGFTRSEYNCGDHRLSTDGDFLVDTVRLDDYPPKTAPLAVKIDCQGAEPSIVAGGMKVLAQADLVVCEFWPWGMRRMGLSPEPMLDFVRSFPFAQVLQHDQPPGKPLRSEDVIPLMQKIIGNGGEHAQADLLLTRQP